MNLDGWLEAEVEGRLSVEDALGWTVRLARTLEILHMRGLVHGRVSTAAIEAQCFEWWSHGALLAPADVAVIPGFHSVDRAAGGPPSLADDIWAAGVVLYRLITGRLPYRGDTDAKIKARIGWGPPRSLRQHGCDATAVQRVMQRLFSPYQMDRIITAHDLHVVLARCVNLSPDPGPLDLPDATGSSAFRVSLATLPPSGDSVSMVPSRASWAPSSTPTIPPPPTLPRGLTSTLPPPQPSSSRPPRFEESTPSPMELSTSSESIWPPGESESARALHAWIATDEGEPETALVEAQPVASQIEGAVRELVAEVTAEAEPAPPVTAIPPPAKKKRKGQKKRKVKAARESRPIEVASPRPARRGARPKRRKLRPPLATPLAAARPRPRRGVGAMIVALLVAMAAALTLVSTRRDPAASAPTAEAPATAPRAEPSHAPPDAPTTPLVVASGATVPAHAAPPDPDRCMAALMPPASLPDPPPRFGRVCSIADPRKGALTIRSMVAHAGKPHVTDAMQEWSRIGAYAMAGFVWLHARCCSEPFVIADGGDLATCSIGTALRALHAAPPSDTPALEAALDAYTRAVRCLATSRRAAAFDLEMRALPEQRAVLRRIMARTAGE